MTLEENFSSITFTKAAHKNIKHIGMKIGAKHIQIIAALILLGSGIALSLHLMVSYSVPLPLFIVMLIMFVFVSMVVFFQDRISGFSWSTLKVEVAAVQKARLEVEELSQLTVRMILMSMDQQKTWDGDVHMTKEFQDLARGILSKSDISDVDPIFERLADNQ